VLRADESRSITDIIFDLYTPPSFEQESYNNRVLEGTEPQGKYKTRHRISAIDDAHAGIAEYAHHLRIVLAEQDDLRQFEKIGLNVNPVQSVFQV
jgi:RNA-dependent RNA polymerase